MACSDEAAIRLRHEWVGETYAAFRGVVRVLIRVQAGRRTIPGPSDRGAFNDNTRLA
jgi:hypothetical protein